jgi:hypothetical protein
MEGQIIIPETVDYLQTNKTPESNESSLRNVVDPLPAEVSVTSNMRKQSN